MSELSLYGGNVAGRIDDVAPSGVPDVMWDMVFNPGLRTNLIPGGCYYPGVLPPDSMDGCVS